MKTPIINYLKDPSQPEKNLGMNGPWRTLSLSGRQGLNPTSIHSRLVLPKHNLNDKRGTLSMWVLSLEDLSYYNSRECMSIDNPDFDVYPFLSDNPNPADYEKANFSLHYRLQWSVQLYAKFYKGNFWPDLVESPQKALVGVGDFIFKKNQWHMLTLAWDFDQEQAFLYINGVLAAREDVYHDAFHRDPCGESLYTGNPTLCYSGIEFYDHVLSPAETEKLYRDQATDCDEEFQKELRLEHAGEGRKTLDWKPDETWVTREDLSLTKPKDLDSFYIQGFTDAPSITEDGLLVETPNLPQQSATLEKQVYLWTRQFFEGDLYVSYEFNPLKESGLSLLVTQASGMNRERFMDDYEPKTTGSMDSVHSDAIRDYHWEYYREMNDTRNDVASHAMLKNPFWRGVAYGCTQKPIEKNQWHRLEYLQIGGKITGAIDGEIVIEATDSPTAGTGGILQAGYIAIRCMIRTSMLFRNLKVMTSNFPESSPVLSK
ncbi:DUF1961 family protein [Pontiella sulfatireligans]|uniref:Uncharacterized protein n=1 Tax=Pontiella sulfatireligans TaxID=2750658 RepID=A0A6C2UHX3_9BACT|nr:DUF1961 family protein [Pontiella sulfatireligans]VGO19057.1 hypothetical protein SCARR_01113 [Pontiella sulfatireligans]